MDVSTVFDPRPDPWTCLLRQNTKAPCTLWRTHRTTLEHVTKANVFYQPERHDVQGGHENQHMKVGHKLRELRVLELTDVSCKGVEVLGQRYRVVYLTGPPLKITSSKKN